MTDELTTSKGDQLANALIQQLLKVIDEGFGPLTGARDYAISRSQVTGDRKAAITRSPRSTEEPSSYAPSRSG